MNQASAFTSRLEATSRRVVLAGLAVGCLLTGGLAHAEQPNFENVLSKPRGIGIGPNGRVFVIDKAGFITRFSPAGKVEHRWEIPDHTIGTPSNICVDRNGRILLPDTHNSRVIVYDADGKELARFGKHGSGPGEFLLPNDIVVNGKGEIFVSEYGGNDRISRFTPDFTFAGSFGGPGSGTAALAAPYGMSLDGDDMIWVADSGNHRVCRFNREGEMLQEIGGLGSGAGEMKYPYDVAWTPGNGAGRESANGLILVCEKENDRIQAFTMDGKSRGMWGEPGRQAEQLNHPTGVACDAGNHVLVADTDNDRINVIALEKVLKGK